MGDKWVNIQGLVFENKLFQTVNSINIAMVGNVDCGKTELIRTFFDDQNGYAVSPHTHHDQYAIMHLGDKFHFLISDARDVEFVRTSNFTEKTVFLFCYDVANPASFDDLVSTWIPPFLERRMPNMHHFSVGIERDLHDVQEAVAGINRQEQRRNLLTRARQLFKQHGGGLPLECSLSNRDSMLSVFQLALDSVHPRTSYN